MIKNRRRQATDTQKLKKLSTVVFSFFVNGSGSGGSSNGGSVNLRCRNSFICSLCNFSFCFAVITLIVDLNL